MVRNNRARAFVLDVLGPSVRLIQGRFIVSLAILALARFTTTFEDPAQVYRVILVYIGLLVLLAVLSFQSLERQRNKAVLILLDLLVISILVRLSGGLESAWFILYLFPVLSVAKDLGSRSSVAVAVLVTCLYAYAAALGPETSSAEWLSFGLRALALYGAAQTVASLARRRDRIEAQLSRTVKELAARDTESKERLQMLYEIGEQLKAEQGLGSIFQKVVDLVAARLRSEEAALFVPEERGLGLQKVAVSGPDERTSQRLAEFERFYDQGDQSLTRRIFENRQSHRENKVPPGERYAAEYAGLLPSRSVRHYMGVPIVLGEDVLGVIRVLNKKGEGYSLWSGEAHLKELGFGEDDLEVLSLIATQVASAMRNAKFLERTHYFENLVYASPDPIMVINRQGRVLNFNRECEKIWGCLEEEALGRSVETFYESNEQAREVGRALWQAQGHAIQGYATRIRDTQGIVIPIRLSASIILDKEGRSAGSIGVFRDERETLRLEEERVRAEKLTAIGKLAQTIGHDIKHDLGAVLNYLSSLEYGARDDPEMRRVYSAMRTATIQAIGKLQNMLMTAKPKPPDKQLISMTSFLKVLGKNFESLAATNQIQLSLACPDVDLYVLGDEDQLRQIFANLFGNSIDAIRRARFEHLASGTIQLEVKAEADRLYLHWEDDGCGMTEEARANAFAPFFSTKDTGSGLGLFITRMILENHNGSISISPGLKTGVSFQVELPLFSTAAEPLSSGVPPYEGEVL
jgi:PAS domain S-box-containing protein